MFGFNKGKTAPKSGFNPIHKIAYIKVDFRIINLYSAESITIVSRVKVGESKK